MKKLTTFRLSPETKEKIKFLSVLLGESQTRVVEIAINRLFKEEKL